MFRSKKVYIPIWIDVFLTQEKIHDCKKLKIFI